MIGKPGPFQIIESEGSGLVDSPMSPPRRRYACTNYATCLDLAAAMNWDNFTCRGCCGQINEALYWRAHQASKRDNVANQICEIPDIQFTDIGTQTDTNTQTQTENFCRPLRAEVSEEPLKVVGKR